MNKSSVRDRAKLPCSGESPTRRVTPKRNKQGSRSQKSYCKNYCYSTSTNIDLSYLHQFFLQLQPFSGLPSDLATYSNLTEPLKEQMSAIALRIEQLRKASDADNKIEIYLERNELKARKILGQHEKVILNEIDKIMRLASYDLCLKDTRTSSITRKSTEITKEVVTKKLKERFDNELKELRFDHVEVVLQDAGGERGALYHKLVLKHAPGVEVPKVASEGEARCLSIAAFFAELSTADDPSTILFDDPVSSLDHKWRSNVAKRLIKEASKRQVVVFTHDVVFLLELHKYAETHGIELKDQHLRREKIGAGVSSSELPWVAVKVGKRISVLNSLFQSADKLYRDGLYSEYDREAIHIYGLLRETWERAFEEVLLNGTVQRYRSSIQTGQIKSLSDIGVEDCESLEAGMTKSSKWLAGHDQAAAENEDVPKPDELKKDIEELSDWVKKIKNRRK